MEGEQTAFLWFMCHSWTWEGGSWSGTSVPCVTLSGDTRDGHAEWALLFSLDIWHHWMATEHSWFLVITWPLPHFLWFCIYIRFLPTSLWRMINMDGLSFSNCVHVPTHACAGEWSEAEDSGVREVRPALLHPGGEEEGDESEGDGRAGREGELYPGPDQEVRRPSGGEL